MAVNQKRSAKNKKVSMPSVNMKELMKSWRFDMTNLEYMAWFLEDTFGAICFHNDPADGYVEFGKDDKREMETLAVYFPNKLDLLDEERAKRLTEKAGDKFYERYVGARNVRLSHIYGNALFARYSVGKRILGILGTPLRTAEPTIMWIMSYFIGRDISYRYHDETHCRLFPLPTNNDFSIQSGDDIKITLEKYLREKKRQSISLLPFSGLYCSPYRDSYERAHESQYKHRICLKFGDIARNCLEIDKKRWERYHSMFSHMSKSDWEDFYTEWGEAGRSHNKSDHDEDFDD